MNELLSYLEERAGWALFIMDQERCDARACLAKGMGCARSRTARSGFLQKLDSIRQVFVGLYRDHVGAIVAAAFEQADSTVLDIHHLLWIRYRTIFWGAHASPDVRYTLRFPPLEHYEATYPGPRPANLPETCNTAGDRIWATVSERRGRPDVDHERLASVEALIDASAHAPSPQEPTEDWEKRLAEFLCGKQSLPVLIDLLSHDYERVRWATAVALGQMGAGAEPAIPALLNAMVHDKSRKAGEALAAIGAAAVAPLIATLANDHREVRWEAVLALSGIGKPAIRHLKQAAREGDESVRQSAIEALDRIRDRSRLFVRLWPRRLSAGL